MADEYGYLDEDEPEDDSELDSDVVQAPLSSAKVLVGAALSAAILRQLQAAHRLQARRTVVPARRAFDAGVGSLPRLISGAVKLRGSAAASVHDLHRVALAASHGVARTFVRVGDELASGVADTVVESIGHLAALMHAATGKPNVLHDPGEALKAATAKTRQLELRRRVAAARTGSAAGSVVRERVLALPVGETTLNQAIDVATREMGEHWWQVERVARTEAAVAFNEAQADGIFVLGLDDPELMQRWTEMVNDLTGAPLDKRVGQDSLAMHGQVARPGAPFHMPSDAGPLVPHYFHGKQWDHPPNRPNDRAILIPWKQGWGIPGWSYRAGARVQL